MTFIYSISQYVLSIIKLMLRTFIGTYIYQYMVIHCFILILFFLMHSLPPPLSNTHISSLSLTLSLTLSLSLHHTLSLSFTHSLSHDPILLRRAIEQEKVVYKDGFERLRILKPEIEFVRKVRTVNTLSYSRINSLFVIITNIFRYVFEVKNCFLKTLFC